MFGLLDSLFSLPEKNGYVINVDCVKGLWTVMFFDFIKRKYRRRYSYYKHYHYYKRYLDKFPRLEDYAKLYAECASKPQLKTGKEIRLSSKFAFGSYLQDVSGAMNVSAFHEMLDQETHCSRLFCKKKIGGFKTRLMMHFYNNRLFLYSYDFSSISVINKEKIIITLKDKYLCPESDLRNKIIVDNQNNGICLDDTMGLVINYMALDSDFFRYARGKVESEDQQRQGLVKSQFQELYDHL